MLLCMLLAKNDDVHDDDEDVRREIDRAAARVSMSSLAPNQF
jgi:hypothetical protein